MEYFQDEMPKGSGLCSDDQCPCDNTSIPVGQGYLYIPRDCCDFRWDCRSREELEAKAERMARQSNRFIVFGHGMAGPILVCEVGAKKRNLDLAVAAADARHWWSTGQVPFRPSPRAGEPESPFTKSAPTTAAGDKGCLVFVVGTLAALGAYLAVVLIR